MGLKGEQLHVLLLQGTALEGSEGEASMRGFGRMSCGISERVLREGGFEGHLNTVVKGYTSLLVQQLRIHGYCHVCATAR